MSKYLSAKYYQNNEERLHKNLRKDIKVFLKKKMKKSDSLKKFLKNILATKNFGRKKDKNNSNS